MIKIIETERVCDYCDEPATNIKDNFNDMKLIPYQGSLWRFDAFEFCESCYIKIKDASVIFSKSIENIHKEREVRKSFNV